MENRDYFETVEKFLKEIYPKNVGGIVMVALLEDDDDHDIILNWNVSPYGLAMAAGILQMRATTEYIEADSEGREQ